MRHLAVQDLEARMHLAVSRASMLLREEEVQIISRVLGLSDEAALLHTRLTGRVADVFRLEDLVAAGVGDVSAAVEELVSQGLLRDEVSWSVRLAHATRDVLKRGCAALGLPSTGRRSDLAERLLGREGWDPGRWVALAHGELILRLERWATLRVMPLRHVEVLERMGRTRWADYVPTGGAIVADRATWDRWEALVAGWDDMTVPTALDALSWSAWPPGRLDLRRRLRRWLLEAGGQLERQGAWHAAQTLYRDLSELEPSRARWYIREARCAEKLGESERALERLRLGRAMVYGPDRLGLMRSGRRVARSLGRGWAPDPPLAAPSVRDMVLRPGGEHGARPLYESAGGEVTVEAAVVSALAEAGRVALRAEGKLWRMIMALLLADIAMKPHRGSLPVPHLAGPLDGWTPEFAARRPSAIFDRMEALSRGEAPVLLQAAWSRWHGVRLSGVRWQLARVEDLVAVVEGIGAQGMTAIARELLAGGRRAFRGLPDLVVLEGDRVRVPTLWPRSLPPSLMLVEVKGEGDTVRDDQAWWFQRLMDAGVRVERWDVSRELPNPRGAA